MIPRLMLLLLLTASALGCDGLPGRPDPEGRYQRPEEVKDFGALYATNCSGCHGANGQLGPATPVGDPLYVALASPEYLRGIIAEGVAGTPMPRFSREAGGTLTTEQIAILARGLGSRWSTPEAESLAAKAPPLVVPMGTGPREKGGHVESGRKVYGQFCASCHGQEGRGGEKAGSIVHAAYLGLVSDQGLRTTTLVGRRDLGMPNWHDLGQRPMAPGEVDAVVAWLASQRAPIP